MKRVDTAPGTVLMEPESKADVDALGTILKAFNTTEELVAFNVNNTEHDTERTPVALGKRNDCGDCGGCGGSPDPTGGLGDLVRRGLALVADLVLALFAGAGVGALVSIYGDTVRRALAEL